MSVQASYNVGFFLADTKPIIQEYNQYSVVLLNRNAKNFTLGQISNIFTRVGAQENDCNSALYWNSSVFEEVESAKHHDNMAHAIVRPKNSNEKQIIINLNLSNYKDVTKACNDVLTLWVTPIFEHQAYGPSISHVLISIHLQKTEKEKTTTFMEKHNYKALVESQSDQTVTLVFARTIGKRLASVVNRSSVVVEYERNIQVEATRVDNEESEKESDTENSKNRLILSETEEPLTTQDGNDQVMEVIDRSQKPSSKRKWFLGLVLLIIVVAVAAVLFKDKLSPTNE